MTESVVGAISPKLEQAEIERIKHKPTESLDAYDYFLRGVASAHRVTRDATAEALQLFAKAIELDPDFATPHGVAAFCYVARKMNGWMNDRRRTSPMPRGWPRAPPSSARMTPSRSRSAVWRSAMSWATSTAPSR